MKDSEFRNLAHQLGAMEAHTRGETLAPGYRPDFTARQDGALRLIIENEPRTDLKAVIGCYQRAEKFCRDANANPSLLIVTSENSRVGVRLAADRLRDFAQFWRGVNPPGAVREVLVLSDHVYAETVRRRMPVLSEQFRELCQQIALESLAAPAAPASIQEPRTTLRPRGEALSLTA
jgi:hypothetical protein